MLDHDGASRVCRWAGARIDRVVVCSGGCWQGTSWAWPLEGHDWPQLSWERRVDIAVWLRAGLRLGRGVVLCATLSLGFVVAGPARGAGPLLWSAPQQADHEAPGSSSQLVSLSCPTVSFCAAADDKGNVLTTTHPTGGYSAWRTVHVASSALSISCPSAAFCVAGDGSGDVLTSTDPAGGVGEWKTVHVAATAIGGGGCGNGIGACHAVSCPSRSLCLAIDGQGNVLSSTDPTGGTHAWKTTRLASGGLDGVLCQSPSFCLVLGDTSANPSEGEIFTSTDPAGGSAAWQSAGVSGTYFVGGAACPSVSLCVAYGPAPPVPGHGDVVTSTDPTGGDPGWTATSVSEDSLTGMSCPSSSLCVGVDEGGHVLTSRDPTGGSGAWTTLDVANADGFPEPFEDVSCPSLRLCVAVDASGNVASSTDPTGGVNRWRSVHVDGGNPLVAVSCPTESFCAAVDQFGYVASSAHPRASVASWMNAPTGDRGMTDISCPSNSLCVAVDDQGKIATSTDPAGRSPWPVASGVFSSRSTGASITGTGVSCASASFCVAIANSYACSYDYCAEIPPGYVASTNDPAAGARAWTSATLKSAAPLSVSCPASSLCVIGDEEGDVITATDPSGGAGAWTEAHVAKDPIVSVSCPSTDLCVAADQTGNVLVSTNPSGAANTWKTTHLTSAQPGGLRAALTGVSCATISLCVAVDTGGNAYTSTHPARGAGGWTAARIDDNPVSVALTAVSCPSPRLCVAVDQAGDTIAGTPAPALSSLRVSPRAFTLAGRRVRHRCVAASKANRHHRACRRPIRVHITYALANATHITVTIQQVLRGRLVNGHCKAPTRTNHRHRLCSRLRALPGAITRAGTPGANSFTFTGKIGPRTLRPGTYRLTATPTAGGSRGTPHTATLRIVR